MGSFDALLDKERIQLDAFVEEYRNAIEETLDALTEEQARRRLVPSATTLLGFGLRSAWAARLVAISAWCRARTSPFGSPTTTPSPPSRLPTGRLAQQPGRRSPTCRSTPS